MTRFQLRIQWKMILIVLIVLLGTLSAVVWKTQALLLEDKITTITDSNIKQIAPVRRLVETKLNQEKSQLVQFAASRASGGVKSAQFGDFDVVSLVQPGEANQWTPSWIERGATAKDDQWPQGYEVTLLKSLPYSKIKDGEMHWTRVSDTQGLPVYAVMVPVEVQAPGAAAPADSSGQLPESTEYGTMAPAGTGKKAVVVGFATVNPLVTVAEDYIGSSNSVYIVDDKGYVAAHTNKAYSGALFSEDPIVQDIMKGQKPTGTGQFEDLSNQPVIAHYERIDRSNVYAVITTPLNAATGLVEAHMRIALVTGLSVGVLGLLLAWVVGRGISMQMQRAIGAVQGLIRGEPVVGFEPVRSNDEVGDLTEQLSEAFRVLAAREGEGKADAKTSEAETPSKSDEDDPFAHMMAAKALPTPPAVPPPVERRVEISAERLANERRAAFEALSAGFLTSVKDPLLAILGHAQLARGKSEDPELRAHAESIEREARRAQEILERMRDFENEPTPEATGERMNVEEVLRSALAQVSSELESEGVEVKTELKDVPSISGSANDLKAALVHVIENAKEAMVNRPSKVLTVSLQDLGDSLAIEVADTGIGMSRDVAERAFEPFYKAFENPLRMGLGLAFVNAALKRADATCDIQSAPGEGTRVAIKFKVTAEDRKASMPVVPEPPPIESRKTENRKVPPPIETVVLTPPIPAPASPTPPPVEEKIAPPPPPPVSAASGVDAPIGFPARPNIPLPDVTSPSPVLGGKSALNETVAPAFPPPPPKDDEESDDDVDEESFLEMKPVSAPLAGSKPLKPPMPPPTKPPAGATVAGPELSFDDDDDDDDEQFTNVSLGQAIADLKSAPVEAPPPPPPHAHLFAPGTQPEAGAGGGFKVKIRRPRTKN